MAAIIEKAANVFVIVACTVIVGQHIYNYATTPAKRHGLFQAGERLQLKPALALDSAPRTLIIATSSTCPYCNASMSYYKEVAMAARKAGVRIVAVSAEALEVNRAYLQSHGISVEQALSQADSGVQVPQIPSLILVRKNGTVIDSWTGMAGREVQSAALKAIDAP